MNHPTPLLCRAAFSPAAKICLAVLLLTGPAVRRGFGQTRAFPEALGFGAFATGGRAGTIHHVTNLADSGEGSFREAVSRPNRIIVFDVGGSINLLTSVQCAGSLTIAGQTAPGGGVGVMGAEVSFYGQTNIICRHFRFRQGDLHNADNPKNAHQNALNLGSRTGEPTAGNMIFDHVSVEFGSWDNIDAVNTVDLTVQNSIIADPVKLQQFGAHTEGANLSWIGNLWVNEHNRQPLAKANTVFVNNVIYDYQMGYTCGNSARHLSHDIIANLFIPGLSTVHAADAFFQLGPNQSVFAAGNMLDTGKNGVLAAQPAIPSFPGTVLTAPWSPLTATIPAVSAAACFRTVLSEAGAWPRDPLDAQVAAQAASLGAAGKLVASQTETGLGNGGYGVIEGGLAPVDTDKDGLPDYWEAATGSDPARADSLKIAADGRALLEHYFDWLALPHAVTRTNAAVEVDLSARAAGFAGANPVYAVFAAENGTVALPDGGHTARFTPAANFRGVAGFKFSARAGDGAGWTNSVGVLVSPLRPAGK